MLKKFSLISTKFLLLFLFLLLLFSFSFQVNASNYELTNKDYKIIEKLENKIYDIFDEKPNLNPEKIISLLKNFKNKSKNTGNYLKSVEQLKLYYKVKNNILL